MPTLQIPCSILEKRLWYIVITFGLHIAHSNDKNYSFFVWSDWLNKYMWICDFAPLESNEDKWAWERSSDDCCDICWFLERKKHWFLRQLDIITHMLSVFLSLFSLHNALKSTIKVWFDFRNSWSPTVKMI